MGRIVTPIVVANALEPGHAIRCDALVDTGSAGLVLPAAWKDRLGALAPVCTLDLETADQRVVTGEVYGPVKVQIGGFRPVFTEVVFIDMQPRDGCYEPLVGYIVLEQSQVAVDEVGHRLVPVRYLDLKRMATVGDAMRGRRSDRRVRGIRATRALGPSARLTVRTAR
jgi:hypothetical protein